MSSTQKLNLHGRSFGRLRVVRPTSSLNSKTRWICSCACGALITVRTHSLLNGSTRSCGCLKDESLASRQNQLQERWRAVIRNKISSTKAPNGFIPVPGTDGRYSISRGAEVFSHYAGKTMRTSVNSGGYRTISINKQRVPVHVLVMMAFVGPRPNGFDIDHINRIKTDNRIENLRYAPRGLNGHNAIKHHSSPRSSRFRGVTFVRTARKPWTAHIRANGLLYSSTNHPTEEEAASAYDRLAEEKYGDAALTNRKLGLL